jgi:hypothetical protein
MAPGDMASARRSTKVLTPRGRTVAYARKQKPSTDSGDGSTADDPDDSTSETAPEDKASGVATDKPSLADKPSGAEADKPSATAPERSPEAPDAPQAASSSAPIPVATDDLKPVAPWPEGSAPVAPPDPARSRTATVRMPVQASIGAPPAMPLDAPPIPVPVHTGDVENPTHMPGPREIPPGNPDDPAPAPGEVPRGDSRSMRRRADQYEFALIYRMQTFVITRFGVVGRRGQWRVVEYPTSASASHAYAKECSRFVSEGFSDYRE